MATTADLRNAVGEHLSILAAGETLSAEDANFIDRAIDRLHAELQEQSIAWWTLSTIPDSCMPALMRMVAADCAHAFMGADKAAAHETKRFIAERRLREITAIPQDQSIISHTFF